MQKINDFGEKIGGAKKDLWKERNMIFEDTIEMTEAEKRKYVKRDNIWKKKGSFWKLQMRMDMFILER